MTYSIIAWDPVTRRTGVAVASCVLAIGSRTLWGKSGLGVASVQAAGSNSDFRLIEDCLSGGLGAEEVVSKLASQESAPEVQVGIVDARGDASALTGRRCPGAAEDAQQRGATAQGNLLAQAGQAKAMLAALEFNGQSHLEERLLASLAAGEAHGGDARGRQSAALLVVPANGPKPDGDDPFAEPLSLRVDDHPDPITELKRLLGVRRGHDSLRIGLPLVGPEPEAAAEQLRRARAFAPNDGLVAQYAALVLSNVGDKVGAEAALAVTRRTPAVKTRLNALLEQEPWARLPELQRTFKQLND